MIPHIKSVMTPFPYSVAAGASLAEARERMAEHDIHQLPVTEGERLVGIIAARDIAVLDELGARDAHALRVRDVCIADPYVVDLNAGLDEVLLTMAARHIDAALVTRKGRLAGVFTATDACRAFGEHLREHGPPPGGDAA